MYVITAVERETHCIVSYDVAFDREPSRLQALVDHAPQAGQYYSDELGAYTNLVYYPGKHQALPNKSQTYSVEADNAELRHYLARLVRRSRCFTRSIHALRDAVKIFIYAWNRRQLARRAHPKYPTHVFEYAYP